MIEISLLMWSDVLNRFSRSVGIIVPQWGRIHDEKIEKYLDINNNVTPLVILFTVCYRTYIISLFSYFYENSCLSIYLINTITSVVGIVWFYQTFLSKNKNILVSAYFCSGGVIELLFHSYMTQSHNKFIYSVCCFNLLCFIVPLILIIIHSHHFSILELNQKKILKKHIRYTKHRIDEMGIEKSIIGFSENDTCYICMDEYNLEKPEYYLLECGHRGHVECLDNWWNHVNVAQCLVRCEPKQKCD